MAQEPLSQSGSLLSGSFQGEAPAMFFVEFRLSCQETFFHMMGAAMNFASLTQLVSLVVMLRRGPVR